MYAIDIEMLNEFREKFKFYSKWHKYANQIDKVVNLKARIFIELMD